jgi:Fe-S cluster assembly protein SufD
MPERVAPYLGSVANFESHAFAALNTACASDGAFVWIPRGVIVEAPIFLVYVTVASETPTARYPRTLIIAEESSQAHIAEIYIGAGEGVTFTNAVTEIDVADNAILEHCKVQQETLEGYHIALTQIRLHRASVFTSHNIAIGGSIARNDINALLAAEGGECTLNGLYLAKGRQLVDTHTAIDHAMPRCNSHELYKGILSERGRGVFNGKIFVRQDAQKTDAKQTNQALLLSDSAQIHTKPQLEIFADGVKCTHGATVGQLSAESLFYLRSRGIGEEEARSLLTYAFASEVIQRIRIETLRDQIHNALFAQLPLAIRPEEA